AWEWPSYFDPAERMKGLRLDLAECRRPHVAFPRQDSQAADTAGLIYATDGRDLRQFQALHGGRADGRRGGEPRRSRPCARPNQQREQQDERHKVERAEHVHERWFAATGFAAT